MCFLTMGATDSSELWLPQYRGFTITQRHTTLCRTPLEEWSVQGRDLHLTTHNTTDLYLTTHNTTDLCLTTHNTTDLYLTTHNTTDLYLTTHNTTDLYLTTHNTTDLYLTTHNTHNSQTSMPPAVFEPAIPASERLQTHPLDRAATGPKLIHYCMKCFR